MFQGISNLKHIFFTLLLLGISSFFLSRIIPPFMSPDENDHIKRSYLLSKGQILLSSDNNLSSGGYIDDGLLKYMEKYPSNIEKISPDNKISAASIPWQGTRTYSTAPGTGYYFPVIYIPQALGLFIGEHIGLRISSSFYLARFLNIIIEYLIIFSAFRIYQKNMWVLALCLLPMTIFQAATASIDGVSLAIFVLCMAIFFRSQESSFRSITLVYLLGFLEIILITCRLQAAPLLLLFIPMFKKDRDKRIILVGCATTLLIISFLGFGLLTTIDHRSHQTLPTSEIIKFYILHPFNFFSILANTLSDSSIRKTYIHQYFGQLGWLDIRFSKKTYLLLEIIISFIMISITSINISYLKERIFLTSLGMLSLLCVFFPLLVTWTPYPSTIIMGVQGRYFTMASLIFAYALSIRKGNLSKKRVRFFSIMCCILFLFSFFETTTHVVKRYYTPPYTPQIIQVLENNS